MLLALPSSAIASGPPPAFRLDCWELNDNLECRFILIPDVRKVDMKSYVIVVRFRSLVTIVAIVPLRLTAGCL
jgi:hypothetical protein